MAIITISRGCYSRGKEVAEALAKRLNYECVSRNIVLEASKEFSIPEIRLEKALHDAPSVLDRFTHGKEQYLSFFRAAFLNHMIKDSVVYYGMAGHFFVQDVQHALKVRIISDLEDRIQTEMERENNTAEEAHLKLKKDDDERQKWSLALYGRDPLDSSLYDLVININTMTVDDAVDILASVVEKGIFKTTEDSQKNLQNKSQLANILAGLVETLPRASAELNDGVLTLANLGGAYLRSDSEESRRLREKLTRSYNLKDVILTQAHKGKKSHVNTFYNLDI